MTPLRVVLDTNVIIAGMLSRRGASYRILALLGDARFEFAISPPLVLEYEAVASRFDLRLHPGFEKRTTILNRLCAFGKWTRIYFHWRPQLPDPDDEFILELAVAGGSSKRITPGTSREWSPSG
jgi:putative PIN family toxin of toxin-antitoxin system